MDNAARLAEWLERLGLADQLEAAGLPTFERDATGAPVWTDPVTGAPPTELGLVELDRRLRQDGSDRSLAVPVELVRLRRLAQTRERLMASEWLDHEGLAARRGEPMDEARTAVHEAARTHTLLVVPHGDAEVVPAFQLGADGHVRPELEPVLHALLASGMDPWRVWGWLTEPAALLGGQVPSAAIVDPGEAPLVLRAAQALARRVAT